MEVMNLVQSDVVQIAVAISGLLTLVLLVIQGWRAFAVPIIRRASLGFRAAREREATLRADIIRRALAEGSYLQAHMASLMAQVHLAMATLILATTSMLFSTVLFVPGVAERGGRYLMILVYSPETYLLMSGGMLAVAMGMLLYAVIGVHRFSQAIKERSADT